MDNATALKIVKGFILLPLEKRKVYLQKMLEQGISPANLPIPQVRLGHARLPLSYAQQRQWFLWQLAPDSAAYHIPKALRLRGRLDVEALQRSFDTLIARHESLRTHFVEDADAAVQVVLPEVRLEIARQSLPAMADEREIDTAVQGFVQAQTRQLFDLLQGPLLRVGLLRMAEDDHVLVLTQHHIVSDGWSMQVMVDELMSLYIGYSQGQQPQLPPLPIHYADYAIWQRNWMEAGEKERQLAYWTVQLGGEQPLLELPLDRPRPAVQSHRGARLELILEQPLSEALGSLAQREGVTLFMLLLASFQVLLHRYSGQADIRVGVPIANRNRVETERLIGFFVNTQVLKAEIDGQMSVSQLLQQVRQTALAAQAHQDLPFEQLVEALQPERSLSHNPLFQVMFNHQIEAAAPTGALSLPGLSIEALDSAGQSAQFDLTLDTVETQGRIAAALIYATDVFDAATIEQMAGHWRQLLQGMVRQPEQRIGLLPMLDAGEQARIVAQWNPQAQAFPSTACVHQLIEAQAPEAIALTFQGQHLDYRQLNERANRLAHKLIEQGVGPNVLVGLAAERGLEMLIGLLAILKAGGAYVPLDPAYPQDRLQHMMQDSGIRLLLTQASLRQVLPAFAGSTLLLEQPLADYGVHNPEVGVTPQDLAYVIYTSGSTGKPKGTLQTHHNVLRLFAATADWFRFGPRDVWSLFHSYAFDFSVWEIFGALMHGGRLLIVPQEVARSAQDFYPLLCAEGVTVLNQTPSAFRQLMHVACAAEQGHALRYIVFGGEALEVNTLQPWFQRFGDRQPQLVNMYGITETTVHVTYRPLSRADVTLAGASPIGELIPDMSWYLLDGNLQPVPKGCIGELYVGRAGLAWGYLNRGDLSAARFVPDPFGEPGARLYRTGDLARYQADGSIGYIGRIDHQVKIRGFRIELGEIEARLLELPAVREAVVLAQKGPDGPQLVAYVVPTGLDWHSQDPVAEQLPLRDGIKAGLREHLPGYMVPAHVLFLQALPLTANGKLNRAALPAIDGSLLQQVHVAPRSEREQQVAGIWAQVLKLEKVGLSDNFFELGGHSLLATQVMSRIRQELGIEAPLKLLFEGESLEDFVRLLGPETAQPLQPIPLVDRQQPLAVSYAQERQWFLWQLDADSSAYHIPMALRLRGALDDAALQSSFDALIARHETLRTRFVEGPQGLTQVIEAQARLRIERQDLSLLVQAGNAEQLIEQVIETQVRQAFDLRQGPLLRATLVRLAADEHVLVLVQHHIVSDGWSMQLMVEELIQLYGAHAQGQPAQLPALALQYADYAAWQRQWMDAGERERQLGYWLRQLEGGTQVLDLPLDHPRPLQQSHRGARLGISLDGALPGALKQLAQREGVTLFMLLLASFQVLLHRYSGQADIRVGVPTANRNRVETERLIGFFVNTQVLKAEVDGQSSFSDFLGQVKGRALEAQEHQDLPFEQLVEALNPERSLSYSPLFQVLFNHQAAARQGARGLEVPGLQVEMLSGEESSTQFDLSLDTFESDDGLWASMTYATDLFEPSTIERLAQSWVQLLQGIVQQPRQRLGDLPLLGAAEQNQLLHEWTPASVKFPGDHCVHQWVEAQARKTPEAEALLFAGQSLSYRELNARANRLAYKLIELGVGPEVRVGVAMQRTPEMVVALLAVLKAGGAYVPLDPDYPQDRLAHMLRDSQAQILLTESALLSLLPAVESLQTLQLDAQPGWLDAYSLENPAPRATADNLAYVIYTSGSTGLPKGVAIAHRNVLALIDWSNRVYSADDLQGVLASTSICFDLSVWELFVTLASGGSIVLARNALELPELADRDRVRLINTVPSAIAALQRSGQIPPSVRIINLAGEPLKQALVDSLYQQPGLVHVYDLYGPSEDTTYSTYTRREAGGQANIGRAISNTQSYIVSPDLQPVPVGSAGELYLAGAGVTRGYLARPGLTAEKFVPNPFSSDGGRLYRTGDLTRYRADGVIEYIGRIDHQVKVRGFRIELGEIEARLVQQAAVREAFVLAQDGDNGQQLVAYIVPSETTAAVEAQAALRESIKAALKEHLPDYMVPTYLLFLEALPLTPNGKLDRKALPKVDAQLMQQVYVAPQSELEQQVAAIWADVLKLDRVGLSDNFFELGGHSLLVAQVVTRVKQQFGVDIPIKSLFGAESLSAFVEKVQALRETTSSLQDELAKSLEALKRLSPDDLEKIIS
ncbi:non-ribosomal peptide synthetase [Pseudomonas sp. 09C 129]|uniref:non-ribosomal peptide synthetase n=1 Tax=Pseudomonas sp. 09C 129 TaxID=2054915 RepID=UPI000C6CCE5D|nr:non-ribosomal peptide synthetase [Pseudomonas sp. 09C 129]AUG03266.1 non-ribosomal peptide synthetase [Pseudomonas sp. 09C 129]